jgi:hypothetical protein
MYPTHKLLNAWTNVYETWYPYHGTWAHLNGVLRKFLRPVCVSICVSPLSLLGNGSVNTFPRPRRIVVGVVFYAFHIVSKESRRLVLPITFCYHFVSCLFLSLTTLLKFIGLFWMINIWKERARAYHYFAWIILRLCFLISFIDFLQRIM